MREIITLTITILFFVSGFSQSNSNRERLIGVHLCTWQDMDGNNRTSYDEFMNLDKMIYDANGLIR